MFHRLRSLPLHMGGTASSQGPLGHPETLFTGYAFPVGLGWDRSRLLPSAAPGGAGSVCCKASSLCLPQLHHSILDFRQMFFLKFIRCLHVTQVQLRLQQLEFVKMLQMKTTTNQPWPYCQ